MRFTNVKLKDQKDFTKNVFSLCDQPSQAKFLAIRKILSSYRNSKQLKIFLLIFYQLYLDIIFKDERWEYQRQHQLKLTKTFIRKTQRAHLVADFRF